MAHVKHTGVIWLLQQVIKLLHDYRSSSRMTLRAHYTPIAAFTPTCLRNDANATCFNNHPVRAELKWIQ